MRIGSGHGHETAAPDAKNPSALSRFSRDHAISLGQLFGRIPWMQILWQGHRTPLPWNVCDSHDSLIG
jgi:hypothetical protein